MTYRRIICLAAIIALFAAGQCWGVNDQSPTSIDNLIEKLRSTDTRGWAARQLVEVGPAAITKLDEIVVGKSARDLKLDAIYALGEFRTPDAELPLRKALKDSDARVRFEAADKILDLHTEETAAAERAELWEPIAAGLLDEDGHVRAQAAWRLSAINHTRAVPLLVKTLDREFKRPREKRGIPQKPYRSTLLYEDATIFRCIVELYRPPYAVASVIEAYLGKSSKDLDYCLALVLLCMDHTPFYSDLLIEGATKSSSTLVRGYIIDQLWKISDPRVEAILETALRDPYAVRNRAGEIVYPIRLSAQNSIEKRAAKAKGLDPLAKKIAPIQESVPSSTAEKK